MKNFFKSLFRSQIIGPFAAAMVVAILVTLTTERFLEVNNLGNLALQISIVSLMAIGSTIVILTAGIDLSPGSMIALLTMVFAECIKFGHISLPISILLILVLGSFLGVSMDF